MTARRGIHTLPATVFAVAILLTLAIPALAQPLPEAPVLRLGDQTFAPARGERPDIPPGLRISGYAEHQRGYYIVQFKGPVQSEWKDLIAAEGGELIHYIPDFAFKVRMRPATAARIGSLEPVAFVGLFHPAYKVSPNLRRNGKHLYRVRIERDGDNAAVRRSLAEAGVTIHGGRGNLLTVEADSAQIDAMASVLDVAEIEDFTLYEKHNEYGAGEIMGALVPRVSGYDGSTQTVAVADTGIGEGTAAGAHPDIPAARVRAIHNWPGSNNTCFTIIDDLARDVDSGHGTHVAVSVVGDGASDGAGTGAAPGASLVFQAIENWATVSASCQALYRLPASGYFLLGLPADLRDLYQQAYDDGARVHSNSWGSSVSGAYTIDSADTDDFIWSNPDLTITFSAGNDGIDRNGNGIVDEDSIGSPATAKNVITVGASENDRGTDWACDPVLSGCSGQNPVSSYTYGSSWPSDFPANPLKNDSLAGDPEQMAAFSSRGPTDDGRIKPDVVAPGTWILSGYSSLYQQGYGDPVNPRTGAYQYRGWGYPRNSTYKYMGGTSMSNPLVAGAAAVVRDFYEKAAGHAASAALVKATLINAAKDLLDENNDGAYDNDFPIPNVHEGWGRVDLEAATDGSQQFVDESSGLQTGDADTHVFQVKTTGAPFKATLVWSDYPAVSGAGRKLVNDLDLKVTAPDGTVYLGNVFSGGWSIAGGSADRDNNVENVYVASAQPGGWTVEVIGFNVPSGPTNDPQPYALVVDAAFAPPPGTPPVVGIVTPTAGQTVSGAITVQIAATDGEDAAGTLTVEWNLDGGSWQPTAFNGSTGYYEASWDTTTAPDGPTTINVKATDSEGMAQASAVNVTVGNSGPPVEVFSEDFSGRSLSGWRVVDEGTAEAPSAWSAETGALVQSRNIWGGDLSGAALPKPGTFAVYEGGYGWTDYRVRLRLRSDDDDAIGFMFRVVDNANYYRFSWDKQRSYRRLVKDVGGVFTQLAADAVPYVQGRTYELDVLVQGDLIEVRVDGALIFSVTDTSLGAGTIAAYSWGVTGAVFDDVLVTAP